MSLLCRGLRSAARPSRQLLRRQQRRADSHDAHHGSGESALHIESGAKGSESFGWKFYTGLVTIPVATLIYSLSTTTDAGPFTRLIEAYRAREEKLTESNMLNQAMVEYAAEERQRFTRKVQEVTGPDLVYPELFNSSSPWNVVAGQGGADLQHLTQHYAERQKRTEESRVARMRDGVVTTVYDNTAGERFPGWMPGEKHKPIDPAELR